MSEVDAHPNQCPQGSDTKENADNPKNDGNTEHVFGIQSNEPVK